MPDLADRRLAVVFPEGRGVHRWQERTAESPVPNAWPYGLDRLADGVAELTPVEVPPLSRAASAAVRAGLRRRIRRSGHDVALCWDEGTAPRMLARVPARAMFAGVIWATDRLQGGGSASEIALLRRTLSALDGLWVLSGAQQDAVSAWLGPGAPPVDLLTFGVDADFYAQQPYPHRPVVVSIGGDRDRDPATLFEALAEVRRRRPDVECVVQSRSGLTPPLGVRVAEHLPHHEVRALYARAAVVAVPTRPNLHVSGMTVGLEAMSVGRPVIASRTPGMEGYVEDGVTGWLTAPGDASAVATAILTVLADPSAAADMGAAGRRRVEARHTTATMCAELLRLVAART